MVRSISHIEPAGVRQEFEQAPAVPESAARRHGMNADGSPTVRRRRSNLKLPHAARLNNQDADDFLNRERLP
jgi:hypothetical protein